LNREIFHTPKEAQILIERWRREYNHLRSHNTLGYCPPHPSLLARPSSGARTNIRIGTDYGGRPRKRSNQ
jgi:transposase InsO family protein